MARFTQRAEERRAAIIAQDEDAVASGTKVGIDDAFGDGFHNIATGQEGTGAFENGGDGQGAYHGEGFGADGRTDIVGNIIGTDVQGHVAADDRGDDDDVWRLADHAETTAAAITPASSQETASDRPGATKGKEMARVASSKFAELA